MSLEAQKWSQKNSINRKKDPKLVESQIFLLPMISMNYNEEFINGI
jgi:hypothetical protein